MSASASPFRLTKPSSSASLSLQEGSPPSPASAPPPPAARPAPADGPSVPGSKRPPPSSMISVSAAADAKPRSPTASTQIVSTRLMLPEPQAAPPGGRGAGGSLPGPPDRNKPHPGWGPRGGGGGRGKPRPYTWGGGGE